MRTVGQSVEFQSDALLIDQCLNQISYRYSYFFVNAQIYQCSEYTLLAECIYDVQYLCFICGFVVVVFFHLFAFGSRIDNKKLWNRSRRTLSHHIVALIVLMTCTDIGFWDNWNFYFNELFQSVFCDCSRKSFHCLVFGFSRTPNFIARSWISGTTIENRPHNYTSFMGILRDKCDICERPIGWALKPAVKCNGI